jgi:hypothetical protein
LVIALLTVAEFFAHEFLVQYEPWSVWLLFLGAFVVGFVVLSGFASWLDRIDSKKKIALADIGVVDGAYMYVVSDANGPLHASVLEIESSVASGFNILRGHAYEIQPGRDDQIILKETGWFFGKGHGNPRFLTYSYEGGLPGEQHGKETGVGHYDFSEDIDHGLRIHGWFLVREKGHVRRVEGRRLTSAESGSREHRMNVLRAYLENEARSLITKPSPRSV